jgi:hypothetical protein
MGLLLEFVWMLYAKGDLPTVAQRRANLRASCYGEQPSPGSELKVWWTKFVRVGTHCSSGCGNSTCSETPHSFWRLVVLRTSDE